eukprot:3111567-Amphidinium_carterae.1
MACKHMHMLTIDIKSRNMSWICHNRHVATSYFICSSGDTSGCRNEHSCHDDANGLDANLHELQSSYTSSTFHPEANSIVRAAKPPRGTQQLFVGSKPNLIHLTWLFAL